MSNFMTLCEDSVVDFITRVEQPIQTMEVSVPTLWMFPSGSSSSPSRFHPWRRQVMLLERASYAFIIPSRRIRQTCVWVHLTPSRSDSDNDHLSCQLSVHEASDNENDKLLLLQLEKTQAHLWSNFSNRFNEIHKISVELGHTIVANQHVVDENLPSIQRAQTCRKCQVPGLCCIRS